jgi:hypothetical protein
VTSVRLLAETGHVGLRVRMEPIVIPVESGLIVVRTNGSTVLVGTAGGLLTSDGREATLFTPLAVIGSETAAVQRAIDSALAEPGPEIAVRKRLGRLEDRIRGAASGGTWVDMRVASAGTEAFGNRLACLVPLAGRLCSRPPAEHWLVAGSMHGGTRASFSRSRSWSVVRFWGWLSCGS